MAELIYRRLRTGEAPLGAEDTTVSLALHPEVDRSKCILLIKVRSTETTFNLCAVRGVINESGDTLTLTRATEGGTTTVSYTIIEFSSGFTNRWYTSSGSTTATTRDITITATTLARTLPLTSYSTSISTQSPQSSTWMAELTTTTNLQMSRYGTTSASFVVEAQVIEFDADSGVTVQNVTSTAASGATTTAAIDAVVTAQSLVFLTTKHNTTSTDDQHFMMRADFVSTTEVRATRAGTFSNVTASFCVVDFGDRAAVQRGEYNATTSSLTPTQALGTAVDPDNTSYGTTGMFNISCWGFGNTFWTRRMFTGAVTGATQLTFTRTSTSNAVAVQEPWQIMDWSGLVGSPVHPYTSVNVGG